MSGQTPSLKSVIAKRTKHNNMDPFLIELFCKPMPSRSCTIIRIVNHDLSRFEEFPDHLFAALGNLLTKFQCFGAFLA